MQHKLVINTEIALFSVTVPTKQNNASEDCSVGCMENLYALIFHGSHKPTPVPR